MLAIVIVYIFLKTLRKPVLLGSILLGRSTPSRQLHVQS